MYMKRLMVLILMLVLSMPAFVSAHDNGNKKHKRNAHTNNGKHKGWYKDGHKGAINDDDRKAKRLSRKKYRRAVAVPNATVNSGGVAKNTGGTSVSVAKKPTSTTSQGGVSKGSGTTSNTGGTAKAPAPTSTQGGTTKK